MRATILSTVLLPALTLALAAGPGAAQVRVGVHVDLPVAIGHRAPVYRPAPPPPPRAVRVFDYSARAFGNWRVEAGHWQVVTLYLLDGRYFAEPIGYARPVRAYQYRGQYFLEPRDRDWPAYQERYMRQDDRRDDRNLRDQRDDRDQGRVVAPPRGEDPRARPRTGGGR